MIGRGQIVKIQPLLPLLSKISDRRHREQVCCTVHHSKAELTFVTAVLHMEVL